MKHLIVLTLICLFVFSFQNASAQKKVPITQPQNNDLDYTSPEQAEETSKEELITNEDLSSGIVYDEENKSESAETTQEELDQFTSEEKSFADESTKQEFDEINKKTAESIQKKAEEMRKDNRPHLQVVPFYSELPAPTLKKKTKTGAKIYATQATSQKYFSALRIGPFYPGSLNGDIRGITFQNVYGSAPKIMVNLDVEWQFLRSVGKLGLQTGLGILGSQGYGRFTSRPSVAAEESISLIVIPLNLSLVYRMQYWDTQPLIPFGGIGGVYYGMSEIRDDKTTFAEKIKFGGGAAWQWFGGVQIMLDGLDKEVLWQLDQDYGINHVYLTANIRQIVGLSNIYDFSALYYEGGFGFEF